MTKMYSLTYVYFIVLYYITAWYSNRRPPKLSDERNSLSTDQPADNVTFLAKGLQGLILSSFIDGMAMKPRS